MSDKELCECGEEIKPGDLVFKSVDGGLLHAECCDEDADSFVDLETGKPCKSPPQPFVFQP